MKYENVGLVTYSTSKYFRQNWIEALHGKFDRFFHFKLDINLSMLQKQKVLLDFIKDNKLDLLIFTIGYQFFNPSFYKKLPVRKLFFFTDDDWTFNIRTRFLCQYANLVVTQSECQLDNYKKFNKNVFCMAWAANPYLLKKINHGKKYDVTFIGGSHSNRHEILKFLKDSGVNLRIFGSGWGAYPDMKDMWGGFLDSNDFVMVVNQSKINLNFLTASIRNMYEMKARLFEIPCAGGFQICEDWEEVYKFYEKDKEIITNKSKEDLLKKINYYLKNDEKREQIAQAGYERTMKEHTWSKRFEKLFNDIGKLANEVYKKPKPCISDRGITVLYYNPDKNSIDKSVVKSLNCQTVPNVKILIISDKKIKEKESKEVKYKCKILNREELKNYRLESGFICCIEDGDEWEPEKLQFQAFALEQDEGKNIYANFAGWGVYKNSKEGEFITYYLRWLRDYIERNELVKKTIIPSALMFNLKGFSLKEIIELKRYILRRSSELIDSIFDDKKNYDHIDIGVSLVRIKEKKFWDIYDSIEKENRKYFLKGCHIPLKKYLLSLLLRFRWIKATELVFTKRSKV